MSKVTSYYELLDRHEDELKFIAAEPCISGEYKKYNNNNGWRSAGFSDTVEEFSHFTRQVMALRFLFFFF